MFHLPTIHLRSTQSPSLIPRSQQTGGEAGGKEGHSFTPVSETVRESPGRGQWWTVSLIRANWEQG